MDWITVGANIGSDWFPGGVPDSDGNSHTFSGESNLASAPVMVDSIGIGNSNSILACITKGGNIGSVSFVGAVPDGNGDSHAV